MALRSVSLPTAASRPATFRSAVRGTRGGNATRRVCAMKVENQSIGSAYAAALLDLAQSKGALEQVHADVDAMAAVLKEDSKLSQLLQNPLVDPEKKKAVIKKIAGEAGFSEFTTNFMSLLVDKGRIEAAAEVCSAFEDQYCRLTDTQVAVVKSADKLDQEQQFMIAKKVQELTGAKNIKLKPVVDERLIAGFVVEYGSSQIDLSIKGQLDKVSAQLSAI